MSLVTRALVALALTVVFYVFALAAAAGLAAFPVLRVRAGESPGLVGLVTPIIAVCILVSLIPRRARFAPPGPCVTRAGQPELLALVEEVADAVGHPMPNDTYLEADVNAGVLETGRLVWRRRVLVLGLPLLEVLTVEQLRAVLAHEFGHYVGGDTRIGRRTYRTRQTILRTVASLRWSDDGDDGWLLAAVRWPFEAYARAFLRITSAISRSQEFAADALAARVAGADAQVGALRRTAACGPAFDEFWRFEFLPALDLDLRPPLGEGFRRYLTVAVIGEQIEQSLDAALEQDENDSYDSHPTVRQRLAALGAAPGDEPPAEGPPASSLLRDHAELEDGLLRALAGPAADALRPASWEDVGARRLASYTGTAESAAPVLAGLTVGDVPALAADPTGLAARIRKEWPDRFDHRESLQAAAAVLAAAFTVALTRAGFAYADDLGELVSCVRGEHRFTPVVDVALIERGDEGPEALADRLAAAGVAGAPLSPPEADGPAGGGAEALAAGES
jgi:Zn-dependent protease with chaperone function